MVIEAYLRPFSSLEIFLNPFFFSKSGKLPQSGDIYQFFADFDPRSGDFLGIAHPTANQKFTHFETCQVSLSCINMFSAMNH